MSNSLSTFLDARAIAVIGASNDPAKRGCQAIRLLLKDGYEGEIYPINPKAPDIQGLKAYPSVLDVDGPIDLAFVCTPAKMLPVILKDCGAKGITGAVVLAAGFAETGEEGAKLAEESLKAAQENNVRIIGPNTNGVFNLHNKMNLVGVRDVEPGNIGIVSQSGNMSLAFIMEALRRGGMGFSTYIGVGNQLDVRFHEYLEYFGNDENTDVPIFYIEGFKNGGKFLETCREVVKKKPVVIYKSGRTQAGQSAAASHTGSLAGSFELTRDLLHQAGATVIEASDKVLSVAEGLSKMPLAKGNRVAILADGGGHATITTDTLVEQGLDVANLSEDTIRKLSDVLPPAAALNNPVDVAGGTDDNPAAFADCADILLSDENVDILMIVGMYGGYAVRFNEALFDAEIETSKRIADIAEKHGKPIAVQSVYATTLPEPLKVLRTAGVPLFIWAENAVRCVTEAVRYAQARERILSSPRIEPGPLANEAKTLVDTVISEGRDSLYEYEAKDLLKAYGVKVPESVVLRSEDHISDLSAEMKNTPLALKIISEDILHKSDAGCVKLKVTGETALQSTYNEIIGNAKTYNPDARIDGVLAAPMARPGVEVIIGVVHDPIFGPVMMFGLGGIFVEVLKDVVFRALPMSRADAKEMIEEIKSAKILDGVRGALPVDKEALVDLIMKVSTLALSHPEISEIDLNPVIVRHDGYDVVDARMILTSEGNTHD